MQALADMGRLFDDEDEARMTKLTDDLTAWINKYAPTFEDPEELLFEVTTPLITSEMEESVAVEPEQPAQQPAEVVSITFSFGDNQDWFVFEQTFNSSPDDEFVISFDFNDAWTQMTKDLNSADDWAKLHDDEWDKLINIQYLQDEEIDSIFKDFVT